MCFRRMEPAVPLPPDDEAIIVDAAERPPEPICDAGFVSLRRVRGDEGINNFLVSYLPPGCVPLPAGLQEKEEI